jgi:hypothetical protein
LTTQLRCGSVVHVTEALYEDAGLRLDEDGITIRHYYFPWAGPKWIGYPDVRQIRTQPINWSSGRGRIWGTSDPRHWLALDIHRGSKRTLLVLDIGRRVKPCITPDDPDRVIELLRDRVPVS